VLADDDPRWELRPLDQARAACQGGAAVVQLRAKHASDAETLDLAREIRELTRQAGVRFVMNDRFDLALLCQADAVHLGQDDLPPDRLPPDARARLAIGRSTHDLAQAERAMTEDVAYLAYGPVFGTSSKQSDYSARGLEPLGAVARRCAPLPVVAIGGVDAARAPQLTAAGARGAAVISAVAGAADPVAAVRELARALAQERT
jgi:thiamine-phosphate pyrophosphorylase